MVGKIWAANWEGVMDGQGFNVSACMAGVVIFCLNKDDHFNESFPDLWGAD
jgi:hypothetical protein